jgi:ammonium transporter, Amt family
MKPHDLIIGATGGLILWFGWYSFNPGSTLSALTHRVSTAGPSWRI